MNFKTMSDKCPKQFTTSSGLKMCKALNECNEQECIVWFFMEIDFSKEAIEKHNQMSFNFMGEE